MSREEDDDVKERVAARLGNPDDDDEDSSERSVNEVTSDDSEKLVSVENVKSEWRALNVYLPEETLHDRVSDEYDRLKYVSEWDVKKGRHYYPALIALGLERIEDMEGTELREFIEELEL